MGKNLFGEEFFERDATKWESMASEFQTPERICRYMVNLLAIDCCVEVLEPTAGKGNIVAALRASDFDVYAPENFWLMEKRRFAACVMNPPFSRKFANMFGAPAHLHKHGMKVGYYILEECMEMTDEVVALMPWFLLSDSDVRSRKLERFGIVGLHALPRSTFGYVRIQTVIVHLRRGWGEDIKFKFVKNGYEKREPDVL